MTDSSLNVLQELIYSVEESARVCREMGALSEIERAALGLPVGETEQSVQRVRLEILDGIILKLKNALARIQLTTNACSSWLDINGGRIACEHPQGHEGPHQKKMLARIENAQRIDATMTWTLAPYLQKVP